MFFESYMKYPEYENCKGYNVNDFANESINFLQQEVFKVHFKVTFINTDVF